MRKSQAWNTIMLTTIWTMSNPAGQQKLVMMIVKARIDKLPKNKYKVINDVEIMHQSDKGKNPSNCAGQTKLFKRYIVSNGINVRRLFAMLLFITRTSAHCLCFGTIVKIVVVSRCYREVFELEVEKCATSS